MFERFLSLEGLRPASELFANRPELYWIAFLVHIMVGAAILYFAVYSISLAISHRKYLPSFLSVGIFGLFLASKELLQALNFNSPAVQLIILAGLFSILSSIWVFLHFRKSLARALKVDDIAAIGFDNDRLTLAIEKATNDSSDARFNYKKLVNQISSDHQAWSQEKEDLFKSLETQRAQVSDVKSKLSEAEMKRKALDNKGMKVSRDNAVLSEQLQAARRQLANAKLNAQKSDMLAKLDPTGMSSGELQKQLDNAKQELLNMRQRLTDDAKQFGDYENEVKELEDLLAQLKAATPVDSGDTKIKSRTVINELLNEVTNNFGKDSGVSKNVTVRYVDIPEILEGYLNPNVLKNTVTALVAYSMKTTPSEGGNVEITLRNLKDRIEIMISSEGRGITPSSSLFEIFKRSGFGRIPTYLTLDPYLSKAKQYMEAIDSVIWIESEVGVGMIFHVEIPMKSIMDTTNAKRAHA